MSSPAYLMPMLSSVLVISASVYSSKRLVPSSVKMTYGAEVCSQRRGQWSGRQTEGAWTGAATHAAVRAILVLVQGPQAQGADVAGDVVAGGDRVVADGVGADEADLDVVVGDLVLGVVLDLEVLYPRGRLRLIVCCCWLGWLVLSCLVRLASSSAPAPPSPSATSSAAASVSASAAVAPWA